MKSTLTTKDTQRILDELTQANAAFLKIYPGDSDDRQPVHTVYGGAQIFTAETAPKLGVGALNAMQEYAPNFVEFATGIGLPGAHLLPTGNNSLRKLTKELETDAIAVRSRQREAWLAYTVYNRVVEKLRREPVEDFRIDFEDGYGNRPDQEEDHHAVFTAKEVARAMREKTLPPFIGIRIKPFTEELKVRSIRTLDLFITTLVQETNRRLPDNFVVTLPKVVTPEQIGALVDLLEMLETELKLRPDSLKMEFMVETPQSIIDFRGATPMSAFVDEAEGRCIAAHFGVYDYTASMNITAAHQSMDHRACDFARDMMKVSLAGTGIWISDGATNVMPVGPHRIMERQRTLTAQQKKENQEVVHRAWRLAFQHTTHSLRNAYYQGWDLHPAQLPVRYGAVYAFFLDSLEAASARLKNFMERAAQATLIGDVFDDAATGQGLLNYFLRGLNCGALTLDDAKATGLTVEEIQTRSFVKILNARREQQRNQSHAQSHHHARSRHRSRRSRGRNQRRAGASPRR